MDLESIRTAKRETEINLQHAIETYVQDIQSYIDAPVTAVSVFIRRTASLKDKPFVKVSIELNLFGGGDHGG